MSLLEEMMNATDVAVDIKNPAATTQGSSTLLEDMMGISNLLFQVLLEKKVSFIRLLMKNTERALLN